MVLEHRGSQTWTLLDDGTCSFVTPSLWLLRKGNLRPYFLNVKANFTMIWLRNRPSARATNESIDERRSRVGRQKLLCDPQGLACALSWTAVPVRASGRPLIRAYQNVFLELCHESFSISAWNDRGLKLAEPEKQESNLI